MIPRAFEIICARNERRLSNLIGADIAAVLNGRSGVGWSVSGGLVGTLSPNTIKAQSLGFRVAAWLMSGGEYWMNFIITHDETWIPLLIITSSELDEEQIFVFDRDVAAAFIFARKFLEEFVSIVCELNTQRFLPPP